MSFINSWHCWHMHRVYSLPNWASSWPFGWDGGRVNLTEEWWMYRVRWWTMWNRGCTSFSWMSLFLALPTLFLEFMLPNPSSLRNLSKLVFFFLRWYTIRILITPYDTNCAKSNLEFSVSLGTFWENIYIENKVGSEVYLLKCEQWILTDNDEQRKTLPRMWCIFRLR